MQPTLDSVLSSPVIVAPMAGGPSTPALVVAAARAGAVGFLAAGYKSAAAVRAEIDAVRDETTAPFGVNVFVPGRPSQRVAIERYVASLDQDLEAVGALTGELDWDDDDWDSKVALLVALAPPVVSFTFGSPSAAIVDALHGAKSIVLVTVTSAAEALLASQCGADALCVQGIEAGAHRGSFSNDEPTSAGTSLLPLLLDVRRVCDLPLVGAGAVMDGDDVQVMLAHGACAVQCGTAFLRCFESGANRHHKGALADERFVATNMTRSFSGRPARGLVNRFMLEHRDAPSAYPEINNATRPLRAAATRKGDLDRMSLWAGTGFRRAAEVPVAAVVANLSDGLAPPLSQRNN